MKRYSFENKLSVGLCISKRPTFDMRSRRREQAARWCSRFESLNNRRYMYD